MNELKLGGLKVMGKLTLEFMNELRLSSEGDYVCLHSRVASPVTS